MRPDLRMCLLLGEACSCKAHAGLTAVGFEPTQRAQVELEATPLDHSGKLSCEAVHLKARPGQWEQILA